MTEFFKLTTHVCCALTGNGWVSYVDRTSRTQSNRRRTFKQNPPVTHSVDSMTNLRHLVKYLLHDSWTGVNEFSVKGNLLSELGVCITDEQIRKSENPEQEVQKPPPY